mmetsp:Transcript_39375/g.94256  ORF Transcript_39375/g.94256 Transcript_39375/m.94256 type:complete len:291 (+) Transcript_39375:296-1168(+)
MLEAASVRPAMRVHLVERGDQARHVWRLAYSGAHHALGQWQRQLHVRQHEVLNAHDHKLLRGSAGERLPTHLGKHIGPHLGPPLQAGRHVLGLDAIVALRGLKLLLVVSRANIARVARHQHELRAIQARPRLLDDWQHVDLPRPFVPPGRSPCHVVGLNRAPVRLVGATLLRSDGSLEGAIPRLLEGHRRHFAAVGREQMVQALVRYPGGPVVAGAVGLVAHGDAAGVVEGSDGPCTRVADAEDDDRRRVGRFARQRLCFRCELVAGAAVHPQAACVGLQLLLLRQQWEP